VKRTPLVRKTPLTGGQPLRRVPLKFRSTRRDRQYRIRRQLARDLEADGPVMCEWPGCTSKADDWHERLARSAGGSITDVDNRACLCRAHHDYLTHDPEGRKEAIALGLVITRKDGAA
jgi:hypothetical protein